MLSPTAIRERTQRLHQLTRDGAGRFIIDEKQWQATVDFVLQVIRASYPDLDVPFHSRWGHIQAGGSDRLALLNRQLAGQDAVERARTKIDTVVVSVLLDAGAGPTWAYHEENRRFNRSEGLAVAAYHLSRQGTFSSNAAAQPWRVDGERLQRLSRAELEKGFQVSDTNPLTGVEGRLGLLNQLGAVLQQNRDRFPDARPGNLLDTLRAHHGDGFSATDLLRAVLEGFGPIWPSRLTLNGQPLGDVWHHPSLGAVDNPDALVPFHKLSQWLTYSLIEPIREAGFAVPGVENLTGLAEYRNGGLFVDMGVLVPRDESVVQRHHSPDSELIVEWRALTLCLLDRMVTDIQQALGLSAENFPAAKVLEGGTWRAGRIIAAQKREDASPPIKLASDGTVF
nr:URC4/urg3 family protein [Acanthopleuribacter pedis]